MTSHLQRKLLLLFLLTLAAALGLVLLLQRNTSAPPVIFSVFADAVLGIAVGTGSRLVLRHRHWLIRAIASATLAIVGLVVLGQLTSGQSGIGPVQLLLMALHLISRAGVRLAPLPVLGPPPGELRSAAHIVLAVTVSWITIRAWTGSHRASGAAAKEALVAEPPPEAASEAPALSPAPAAGLRPPRFSGMSRLMAASAPTSTPQVPSAASRLPSFPRKAGRKMASAPRSIVHAPSAASRLLRFSRKTRHKMAPAPPRRIFRPRAAARHLPRKVGSLWPVGLRRKSAHPRASVGTASARTAGRKSRWGGILRRKPHVQLAAHEEHRCPYCLEHVLRNDPRGSIECPVCHTFHHKDCWDITGTCQVPHLNA